MSDLKSCPFCGCPAHKLGGGSSRSGQVPFMIKCVNVLCAVEISASSKEEAENKWNSRKEQ